MLARFLSLLAAILFSVQPALAAAPGSTASPSAPLTDVTGKNLLLQGQTLTLEDAIGRRALSSFWQPLGLRACATGARLSQLYGATPHKNVMSVSDHIMRCQTGQIQMIFCTFAGTGEANNGVATPIKLSLLYPTINSPPVQVTFGGNATGTIPAGGCLTSDATTAPPNGARFWLRDLLTNTAGVAINNNLDSTQGDGSTINDTTAPPDSTMASSFTPATLGQGITPTAIIGYGNIASIGIAGDSRAHGLNYTPTGGQPDTGSLAGSIGPALPYLNVGWSAETAAQWNAGHTWRAQLLNQYTTHVVFEYGFNDMNLDQATLATVQSRLQTAASYINKPIAAVTVEPGTLTSDNCTSFANQKLLGPPDTPGFTTEPVRLAYNAAMRAGPPSWAPLGYFDMAAPVEAPQGYWVVGTSIDCVHTGSFGGVLTRNTAVVDLFRFSNSYSAKRVVTGLANTGDMVQYDNLGTSSNTKYNRSSYFDTWTDNNYGAFLQHSLNLNYETTQTAISAAGTDLSTCYPLTKKRNFVATVTAGQGVCIPTWFAAGGMSYSITIFNGSGVALKVYPFNTSALLWPSGSGPLAAGAAYSVPALTKVTVDCYAATICDIK